MYDLIDDFYVSITGTLVSFMYETGQFFMAPALYLINKNPMNIVRGQYNQRTKDYDYQVTQAKAETFSEEHEPVKTLDLRSNERAAIVRCKMRPVVIVSSATEKWKDGRRYNDDCFLVAPVYSVRGNDGKLEYSDGFVKRVQAYAYNTFFYLSAKKDIPRFDEGFIRFDRLQVIHKSWLQHMRIRLGPEAIQCLEAWLPLYVAQETGTVVCESADPILCLPKMAKFILEYRAERMEQLGIA